MDQLLAGPYFGRKWKDAPDAQCQMGGFDEFLVAMIYCAAGDLFPRTKELRAAAAAVLLLLLLSPESI
jgi:hypothetical protein